MPRKLPKHVDRNFAKGRWYYYFRVGKGSRTPLPGAPGSDEFEAAYAAALTGKVEERRITPPGFPERSLGALITKYYESAAFKDLKDSTKVAYRGRMEKIKEDHGHRSVAGMTREGIEKGILRAYADRPGAYRDMVKKLSILANFAMSLSPPWITTDPTYRLKKPKSNEIRSWTEAEIEQFEKRWPIGTKQRLAFALMLFTGQRRSDVHRMTWADIDAGRIRVVQLKTGRKLWIRIHVDLAKVLQKASRAHVTIINTEYGKPFTVDGFSGFMRDAITAADLPLTAQPHGLRKAAGRRLAEAGATAHQIMAVLGHTTLAEAERYTREADQQRLADEGIGKVEAQRKNRGSQTGVIKFGKRGK
jgi:integrase